MVKPQWSSLVQLSTPWETTVRPMVSNAVRKAADEAPLFQCGDQPVDARLGAQIERFLHFIKRRRDAVTIHPDADEIQKFQLLARKHLACPL